MIDNCVVGNQPETEYDEERDFEPVYATLHFYYNDPDSMRRLRECLDAPKWKSAVREFDQWMRVRIKYGSDGAGAGGPIDEGIRAHLHTIFGEHGIDILDD